MQLSNVIQTLRLLDKPAPIPRRLPTEAEVSAAERALGIRFSDDYRYFLLNGSNVDYGILEPAQVTPNAQYKDLVEIATRAWKIGVPRDFLPFCEENGDYYCFAPDGRIGMLSHDRLRGGSWPDLAHWIQQVWIDEFQEMENESPSA